jgi:hypothetical protein
MVLLGTRRTIVQEALACARERWPQKARVRVRRAAQRTCAETPQNELGSTHSDARAARFDSRYCTHSLALMRWMASSAGRCSRRWSYCDTYLSHGSRSTAKLTAATHATAPAW